MQNAWCPFQAVGAEYNREALAIAVDFSLTAERVVRENRLSEARLQLDSFELLRLLFFGFENLLLFGFEIWNGKFGWNRNRKR